MTSGGLRDSYIVRYNTKGFDTEKEVVESVSDFFGRPNVLIWKSDKVREPRLIYSLDVSMTYKWGIQIAEFENEKYISKRLIPLESGFSPFHLSDYQPSNFPIKAIQLGKFLYFNHWKTKSIYRLNLEKENGRKELFFKGQFIISHMATDKKFIYMVNKDLENKVLKLNLKSKSLKVIKDKNIIEPVGIAVSDGIIAVADRINGLVIVNGK